MCYARLRAPQDVIFARRATNQRDVDAFYESNMSAADRNQFWSTFNAVATREAYRRPSLDRGSHRGVDMLEAICDCWPSAFARAAAVVPAASQSPWSDRPSGRRGMLAGNKSGLISLASPGTGLRHVPSAFCFNKSRISISSS